jgi:hypothetical protein
MQKTLFSLLLFAVALPLCLTAQTKPGWHWGLEMGLNKPQISGLKEMIIPRIYPDSTYQAEDAYRKWLFSGGAFLTKRYENSPIALYFGARYDYQGGRLRYHDFDTIPPLDYNIHFRYQSLSLLPMVRIYPFWEKAEWAQGIRIGLGAQMSFNVTNNKIRYRSDPDPQYDIDISYAMGRVLKGRTDVSVIAELGYEYWWEDKDMSIHLNGRFIQGVKDMIETQANGFGFIENDNISRQWQISLGATFLLVED